MIQQPLATDVNIFFSLPPAPPPPLVTAPPPHCPILPGFQPHSSRSDELIEAEFIGDSGEVFGLLLPGPAGRGQRGRQRPLLIGLNPSAVADLIGGLIGGSWCRSLVGAV